jgi:hypothetical protein
MKRVLSLCCGLGLMVAFAGSVSAQEYIEVLPEVGTREVVAEGNYYSISTVRVEDPAPGFRAYDVMASVNGDSQGKFVNAFQELNITGVHQLWEDFRGANPSPYPGYFTNFDLPGQELDSYMMWTKADQSNGADPSETNDGSNPAGLQYSEFTAIAGIGEVGVTSRGNGNPAALGLTGRATELALAHIVLYDGVAAADGHYATAMLSGDLGGEGDANESNGGEIDMFSGVVLGAPTLVEVPEPAMGIMALMSVVGLLGFRRR